MKETPKMQPDEDDRRLLLVATCFAVAAVGALLLWLHLSSLA